MAYEGGAGAAPFMPVPTGSALVCYPSQMSCLLSCVLLMVRGRASSLTCLRCQGEGKHFSSPMPPHGLGVGVSPVLMPSRPLTCTPSTGQLYCVVQARCRTRSPMCSCRWGQCQLSHWPQAACGRGGVEPDLLGTFPARGHLSLCQLDAGPPCSWGAPGSTLPLLCPTDQFFPPAGGGEGHGVSLPHPHHCVTGCGIKFLLILRPAP